MDINLKTPRPNHTGDFTRDELKTILEDLMTRYSEYNGGPSTNIRPVDQKAPQYLFYLLYEEYINKLSPEDKAFVWSGIKPGNNHMTQAYSLSRLVRYCFHNPTTTVVCQTLQRIYYGAPGTGKSYKAKVSTKGYKVFRTTFHPDTDYASFIGSYKPVVNEHGIVRDMNGKTVENEYDRKIEYNYIPQIFTNAYLEAWRSMLKDATPKPVCILIEELNRGNCAQIFGDLFQLLDRSSEGFSEYSILAQEDLAAYIKASLGSCFEVYYNKIREKSDLTDNGDMTIPDWDSKNEINNKLRLCLPPNLSIVCTMNTSDQSLFPMDSAFKRRWDWEYVPIDYYKSESQFIIAIDDTHKYSWPSFLKKVNGIIYEQTKSEDKQMGNFFVKGDQNSEVDCDQFVSKVMYYLWSEICKDNPKAKRAVFVRDAIVINDGVGTEATTQEDFAFNDLFPSDDAICTRTEIIDGFMSHHGIENCAADFVMIEPSETAGEDVKQRWEHSIYIDELIGYINETNTERFREFKTLFPGPYKTHLNGFVVKTNYGGWIGLSRNKDANLVCYGNHDVTNMKKILSDHGQEIMDNLGIPAFESKVRSDSRWMFTEQQGQAKLAAPHKLNRQEEFEWFVESALKVYDEFKKYFPTA